MYRDGTADQSHPPSKRPIFDRVWRDDNNKIVCTLATIMHVFFLHANTYWELDGLLTCGNVLGAKEQLFGHSLLLFFAHTHVPLV